MSIDPQQAIQVVVGLATVLLLASVAPNFPYRRVTRIGAIAVYGVAVAAVLVWVGLWLLGPGR